MSVLWRESVSCQNRKKAYRHMMEETTRLNKVLTFIKERGWKYSICEEDGCGSIDFEYRGVPYHIWEFHDKDWGVETNLRHGGRQEEILGDYETELIEIMKDWH